MQSDTAVADFFAGNVQNIQYLYQYYTGKDMKQMI